MAEILCLTCKETVTFGDHCKCFSYGRNGKQYSLPKIDTLNQENAEYIEAKQEYMFTPLSNYINLNSEFKQIQIKDYENVGSIENENNEEGRLCSDLNEIKKIPALTDKKGITEIIQNQSGDSISSLNFMENAVYFNDFPLRISTKTCEANYKTATDFCGNRKQENISTSFFHQQRSCETDRFNYTDLAPSIECEMMCHKNNFPSFYPGDKLHKNTSGSASQETNLEKNYCSTTANFLINTNFWPVTEKSYKNVNKQSEVNLTECLNFLELAAPTFSKSTGLDDKVSNPIEFMKDENSILGPSVFHSDFNKSHNTKPVSEKIYECDNSEKNLFNEKSFNGVYKSNFANNVTVFDNSQHVISRTDQLETRKRKNTLEKQFICNFCEKSFHFKCRLNNHYRIHTNEKPFVCNTCGKGFAWQSNFIQHCRMHTGEKPYECDKCKRRFTRKDHLNDHYKGHTNERPFGCDFCEKRFKRRKALVVHRRTHTGEKPFECNLCEKRFPQLSILNTHYRTHTGKKL